MTEQPLKIYWVERNSLLHLGKDDWAIWAYYDMGDGKGYTKGYLTNNDPEHLVEIEKHFSQSIETLEYH